MIAYNTTKLNNLLLHEQLKKWKRMKLFPVEVFKNIVAEKRTEYHHSNIFIRIGVFLLSLIVAGCSVGLIVLFFSPETEIAIGTLLIIGSFIFYGALEYVIREKNIYSSGIDEALLYGSLLFVIVGIAFLLKLWNLSNAPLIACGISFPLLVFAAFRFTDSLISVFAYASLLGIFFFGIPVWFGMTVAKIVLPFFTMLISFAIYSSVKKYQKNFELRFWKNCLHWLEYATIFSFYAGGNYYVVRELSTSFFNVDLKSGDDIPLAWFFYSLTVLIPLALIILGLKRHNKPFLICGLVLCIAAVATIRYYHSILPLEWALTLGGLVMLSVAVIAYFKFRHKKEGITYEEDITEDPFITKDIEAILIAQIMRQPQPQKQLDFGGGDFGGGGAGGNI